MEKCKLIDAAIDLRYLLDRGYKRERVLDIIVERYLLDRKERSTIYRCIHSTEEALKTIAKLVVRSELLALDLFNSLITLLAMIEGDQVYLCDDCLARDVRGSKIRSCDEPHLIKAISMLAELVSFCKPRELIIVAEKQISNSIFIAKSLQAYLGLSTLCRIDIVDRVDSRLIELCKEGFTVASTDIVILRECKSVYPLTTIALMSFGYRPRIDFASIFNIKCFNLITALLDRG